MSGLEKEQIIYLAIGVVIKYLFDKIVNWIRNFSNSSFKNELEKDVNTCIKEINQEAVFEVVPRIKLQIVDSKEGVKYEDNSILVFVKKEKKPSVKARVIFLALDNGFLKDAKRVIGTKNAESAKYSVGKLIITKEEEPEQWNNDIKETLKHFERLMEDSLMDNEIRKLIGKHEILIRKKLFKTIFLQELYAIGERLIGKPSEADELENETIELLNFLWNIAMKEEYEKEYGKEPPLDFTGKFYKVGLVLVKRPEVIDLSSHIYAIKKKVKSGRFLSIYILGWGKNANELEEFIGNWLKNKSESELIGWEIKKTIRYKVKFKGNQNIHRKDEVPGLCIVFAHRNWV